MSASGEDHEWQTKHPLKENILTVHEMAAYLRLPEPTICKLAAFGELPGFMIGGSWRFDRGKLLGRIAAAKSKGKKHS
jgi:excisionase family DNA binding protein